MYGAMYASVLKLDLSEFIKLENGQSFSQTDYPTAKRQQLAKLLFFVVILIFIAGGAALRPAEQYLYVPDKRSANS